MRALDPILGVPVHTTRYAPEWCDGPPVQFRFPRSRAYRVKKKWAQRAENYRPSRVRYVVKAPDSVLIMHPSTYYAMTGD